MIPSQTLAEFVQSQSHIKLAFIVILVAVLYFLPSLIAYSRGHVHLRKLALLNLISGWSILAWGAILVWSFYRQGDIPDRVKRIMKKT